MSIDTSALVQFARSFLKTSFLLSTSVGVSLPSSSFELVDSRSQKELINLRLALVDGSSVQVLCPSLHRQPIPAASRLPLVVSPAGESILALIHRLFGLSHIFILGLYPWINKIVYNFGVRANNTAPRPNALAYSRAWPSGLTLTVSAVVQLGPRGSCLYHRGRDRKPRYDCYSVRGCVRGRPPSFQLFLVAHGFI